MLALARPALHIGAPLFGAVATITLGLALLAGAVLLASSGQSGSGGAFDDEAPNRAEHPQPTEAPVPVIRLDAAFAAAVNPSMAPSEERQAGILVEIEDPRREPISSPGTRESPLLPSPDALERLAAQGH